MTYLSEEKRLSLYLGFDTELLESSPARRKMYSHPNYCISGYRYTLCRLPITTLNKGYTLTEPLKFLLLLTSCSLLPTTPRQSCSLQANHTGTSRYGASESWVWALDYVVLFSCCQSWTKMQEAHWNTASLCLVSVLTNFPLNHYVHIRKFLDPEIIHRQAAAGLKESAHFLLV